jgi:hypothetical protein
MAFNVKKTPSYSGTGGLIMKGEGGRMVVISTPAGPPPPPPSPISTQNLILYLDAANTASYSGSGTTWFDLSGNGNNATMSGSPTYTSAHGGGFTNFSSGFFSLTGLTESYAATGLSVFSWVRATNFAFGVHKIIERETWGSASGWGLYAHMWPGSKVNGPRYAESNSSINLAVDTNYYVGFTISSGGEAKVFINGAQSGTTSTGVVVPTAATYSPRIGNANTAIAGNYNPYPWQGNIYEVHMHSKNLSEAEILANFNGTKTRFGL